MTINIILQEGSRNMKKNLIYLIGFPGVGKLTIAKEICKRENYVLQDNHKTVNLLFPFLDCTMEEI